MIRFSVGRPVAVGMAYAAVALVGVASWLNVPVELLPETELPRLSVSASWQGASPETTEAFLTSPLEAAVQQVRGVESVSSVSYEQQGAGVASVDVAFVRGVDMDFTRLELSERLAALEGVLPPDATRPVVEPYVPEEFQSQRTPFLRYTLTGPYTVEELRRQVDDLIAPEVRQVRGVADVRADGGRARLLEIEVDEARVLALGLSPEDIRRRVQELEIVREAGRVDTDGKRLAVAIRERAGSTADVRRTPLLTDRGRLVRLEDVAALRDTYEEPRSHYRIDGRPAVGFVVVKELGTNVVRVADAAKARIDSIGRRLPPGSALILDDDESEGVRTQLTDLRYRALSSALIVLVVLVVFLRSFRSAVVVFASIAFAVLITLNLVYFGGLTLNVLTLMGLAMGFGLIIDNAVVVLENVYRRRRMGDGADEAAVRGAGEMVLPVLAATLTTVIVLLPFLYLQGEVRTLYVPLAIVVGFTNIASLFVTFTFTPALAGRLMRSWRPPVEGPGGSGPLYARGYAALVRGSLRRPWVPVAVAVVMLGGSGWLFVRYVNRGTVWQPWSEQRSYIDINISQPRGEELTRTDDMVRFFERRVGELPEVARYTTRVYPQVGRIQVTFPDSLNRTSIPLAIKEQLESYSHLFGGAEVRVYGYGPSFYGGGSTPPNYSIQVLGYNYRTVRDIAEALGRQLKGFARVQDVDTNSAGNWYQRDRATEVVLRLDRARLGMHGISAAEVVARVNVAVGRDASRAPIRVGDEEMRFRVRFAGAEALDLLQLENLLIPAPGGTQVRLGDVATLDEREVMSRIVRRDQQYERTVSYEFRGPVKLGDRTQASVIRGMALPAGYQLKGNEGYRWTDEERIQIYGVLGVSLVLVFMVTAALFESLRQPLCVLLTVPMALIGVFLVFFFANASFTREAFIGVIMMGGVVVNNAMLLVDHVNQLRRKEHLPLRDAIERGTMERVRPILMTSAVTILGLLPLVIFSEAADANIWNALGYSLLGGLLSSTFLVLTVTPALYLLFERGPERRRLARDAEEAARATPAPEPA